MTRLLASALLAVTLAGPAAAQARNAGAAQLAASVAFDLRRLGYDVEAEEITMPQAVQLHFLLDEGPFLGGIAALRLRQRIETILARPEGAGTRF